MASTESSESEPSSIFASAEKSDMKPKAKPRAKKATPKAKKVTAKKEPKKEPKRELKRELKREPEPTVVELEEDEGEEEMDITDRPGSSDGSAEGSDEEEEGGEEDEEEENDDGESSEGSDFEGGEEDEDEDEGDDEDSYDSDAALRAEYGSIVPEEFTRRDGTRYCVDGPFFDEAKLKKQKAFLKLSEEKQREKIEERRQLHRDLLEWCLKNDVDGISYDALDAEDYPYPPKHKFWKKATVEGSSLFAHLEGEERDNAVNEEVQRRAKLQKKAIEWRNKNDGDDSDSEEAGNMDAKYVLDTDATYEAMISAVTKEMYEDLIPDLSLTQSSDAADRKKYKADEKRYKAYAKKVISDIKSAGGLIGGLEDEDGQREFLEYVKDNAELALYGEDDIQGVNDNDDKANDDALIRKYQKEGMFDEDEKIIDKDLAPTPAQLAKEAEMFAKLHKKKVRRDGMEVIKAKLVGKGTKRGLDDLTRQDAFFSKAKTQESQATKKAKLNKRQSESESIAKTAASLTGKYTENLSSHERALRHAVHVYSAFVFPDGAPAFYADCARKKIGAEKKIAESVAKREDQLDSGKPVDMDEADTAVEASERVLAELTMYDWATSTTASACWSTLSRFYDRLRTKVTAYPGLTEIVAVIRTLLPSHSSGMRPVLDADLTENPTCIITGETITAANSGDYLKLFGVVDMRRLPFLIKGEKWMSNKPIGNVPPKYQAERSYYFHKSYQPAVGSLLCLCLWDKFVVKNVRDQLDKLFKPSGLSGHALYDVLSKETQFTSWLMKQFLAAQKTISTKLKF